MHLTRVLRISRPRFRIYELGPYMIGVLGWLSTTHLLLNRQIWLYACYFLIPANILIYGINDIFDYETDKLNPKKQWYEELVQPKQHNSLWLRIILTNLPFLFFLDWSNIWQVIAFMAFIFFASMYSARPIRAKARPVLDSVFSASHYIATGIFGYFLVSNEPLNRLLILAGVDRAIAMHAYSAIPDIHADKEAWLETIATTLGKTRTLRLCIVMYVLAIILSFEVLGIWSIGIGTMYIFMMLISFRSSNVMRLYKRFPLVNTLVGMMVFLMVIRGKM